MKTMIDKTLTFTVPLTQKAHLKAEEFYRHQSNREKGKQVYLNTLAVYAVYYYLNCMEIEAELEESYSWDMFFQTLSDTADLQVKNWGRLECRPVLPGEDFCSIPPEVWGDRKGYIAVEFDRNLTEAKLLGFISTVNEQESIALDEFESLEVFLEQVSESLNPAVETLETKEESPETPVSAVGKSNGMRATEKPLIQLRKWLNDSLDTGWETIQALFPPVQPQPAFNFRLNNHKKIKNTVPTEVKGGKRIDLQWEDTQIVFLMGLSLTENAEEIDITVEIIPVNKPSLPKDLELLILDRSGKEMLKLAGDNSPELLCTFAGELGEEFSVKIVLGDFQMMERFLI